LAAIDAVNAEDPNVVVVEGVGRPKELVHAELMTRWLIELDPTPDDAQRLAARAHHLRRWALPRSQYPDGRAGYLRWRTEQRRRHAAEVASILDAVGYDAAIINRVTQIVSKQGLRATGADDAAVQTHEDALCLTFLITQLEDLANDLGAARTVEVLAKTVAKMSEAALARAQHLELSPQASALLADALVAAGRR